MPVRQMLVCSINNQEQQPRSSCQDRQAHTLSPTPIPCDNTAALSVNHCTMGDSGVNPEVVGGSAELSGWTLAHGEAMRTVQHCLLTSLAHVSAVSGTNNREHPTLPHPSYSSHRSFRPNSCASSLRNKGALIFTSTSLPEAISQRTPSPPSSWKAWLRWVQD